MADRRIIVDYDGDPDDGGTQNLRDPETGQFVEMGSIVGATIIGVERGEKDQLVFVIEGGEIGDIPA
jgi:hypothetical protein